MAVQSIILTGAKALGFGISLAVPVVLVRVFSPENFGLYKQVFLVSGTLLPLADLGMYASIFYFVPQDERDGHRWVTQAMGMLAVTGAASALLVLFASDWVAQLFNAPGFTQYALPLAIYVFLAGASQLVLAIPVVDRRPLVAGATMAGSDLLNAGLIVLAALTVGSLRAVIFAAIVAQMARLAWLLTYVRLRREPGSPDPSWSGLRTQLSYALPFGVAIFFDVALQRAHQYMVAAQVTPQDYAIYAVGILSVPVVGMFVQSVVEVLTVRVATYHKERNFEGMRTVWTSSVSRLAVILVGSFVCVQAFAADLIGLLFGDPYLSAVPILRVYLLTLPLMLVVDHAILRATNDTRFIVGANAAGLGVSVVIMAALRQSEPLMVGVIAFIGGLATARIAGLWRVGSRLELSFPNALPWHAIASAILVSALCAVPAVAATSQIPLRIARLILGFTLFGGAYLGMVYRFELIPRSEVHQMLRRLRPRGRSS